MSISTKACSKCGEIKPIFEFHKDSSKRDGLYSSCKQCANKLQREYAQNNKEKMKQYHKEYFSDPENVRKRREYSKKWYEKNKEKKLKQQARWRENNREYHKEYIDKWYEKNPEYHKEYIAKRRKDPEFRLINNLRGRVSDFVRGKNRGKTTKELLGCNWNRFKKHIEVQFEEGMSWDKYGLDGWEIDHIIPCSAFDLTNPHAQAVCFHYSNLQPMWKEKNISKSDSIPDLGIEIDREWLDIYNNNYTM